MGGNAYSLDYLDWAVATAYYTFETLSTRSLTARFRKQAAWLLWKGMARGGGGQAVVGQGVAHCRQWTG